MKSLTLFLAAVVLMVGSAFAQDKVELSGAYQFTTVYANGTTTNSNPGWNASATYYLGHSGLGITTDWTGTDFNAGTKAFAVNTGAGGLQYQFNRKGILRPYVNVLVGDTKYTTSGPANALSTQVGAAVWTISTRLPRLTATSRSRLRTVSVLSAASCSASNNKHHSSLLESPGLAGAFVFW
jgi:hypothetical protein